MIAFIYADGSVNSFEDLCGTELEVKFFRDIAELDCAIQDGTIQYDENDRIVSNGKMYRIKEAGIKLIEIE